VQQRCGVNEFHSGSKFELGLASVSAHFGSRQGDHGPDSLAAGINEMAGKVRDHLDRTFHSVDNDVVHPGQLFSDQ